MVMWWMLSYCGLLWSSRSQTEKSCLMSASIPQYHTTYSILVMETTETNKIKVCLENKHCFWIIYERHIAFDRYHSSTLRYPINVIVPLVVSRKCSFFDPKPLHVAIWREGNELKHKNVSRFLRHVLDPSWFLHSNVSRIRMACTRSFVFYYIRTSAVDLIICANFEI